MNICCLDLEGVLIPEIWIKFAEKTKIEELKLTTRDIPNYSDLMNRRIKILKDNNLKLSDIQEIIGTLEPFEGALNFLNWIKSNCQLVVLSDTFYEFSAPLMKKLEYPTLFCNNLEIDNNDNIIGFSLRQNDGKRKAVKAFHSINFKVIAAGDSYNDATMLTEADKGIFFCPPESITKEYPNIPITINYTELKSHIEKFLLKNK